MAGRAVGREGVAQEAANMVGSLVAGHKAGHMAGGDVSHHRARVHHRRVAVSHLFQSLSVLIIKDNSARVKN